MSLTRLNYFTGKLLTADDFRAEQNYFLQKSRRHNRCLHGYGVACGLAVEVGKGGSASVTVEPGLAVDCWGNEIEITEAVVATLNVALKQKSCYVVVEYVETPCDEIPALLSVGEGASSTEASQPSRIKETFKLGFHENDPLVSHSCKRGHKTCGKPHPIPIGRLRRGRKGWALDRSFIVPRCK